MHNTVMRLLTKNSEDIKMDKKYRRPENRPLNKLTDRQLIDKLELIVEELSSRGIFKNVLSQLKSYRLQP